MGGYLVGSFVPTTPWRGEEAARCLGVSPLSLVLFMSAPKTIIVRVNSNDSVDGKWKRYKTAFKNELVDGSEINSGTIR